MYANKIEFSAVYCTNKKAAFFNIWSIFHSPACKGLGIGFMLYALHTRAAQKHVLLRYEIWNRDQRFVRDGYHVIDQMWWSSLSVVAAVARFLGGTKYQIPIAMA